MLCFIVADIVKSAMIAGIFEVGELLFQTP